MLLQREIIAKERKVFDIERRLRQSADEVRKLKDERDRLVQISNDLRAELNRARRTISEYKGLVQNLEGGKGGAARLAPGGNSGGGGNNGPRVDLAGNAAVHAGKSMFSFDEPNNSNMIKEDSKESLTDSAPPSRTNLQSNSRSPHDLPRSNDQTAFQEIQVGQQKQLQNLGVVVTELAQ